MQLTLTGRQRFSLEAIIRTKRSPNVEDAVRLMEIFDKIKVSDEERKHCFIQNRLSGQPYEDPRAIDALEPLVLELERAQVALLKTRLTEWQAEVGVSTDDLQWFIPLKEAVDEGAKYKAAKSATEA